YARSPERCPDFCAGYDLNTRILAGQGTFSATRTPDHPIPLNIQGQVRRYPGWHRHMTLAMAAHACLTVLRARQLDQERAETDPPSSSISASLKSDG
ncbi:hypothetical protein ACFWD7_57875, partial [Streptomyces mirabilis]